MLVCLTEISAAAAESSNPRAPYPQPRYTPPDAATFQSPSEASLDLPFDQEAMQAELDALKREVNHLRRRDETLKFYMTRLDEEMRLAARLQQEFLPRQLPQIGPVHFHTLFRPASYVSGDLYDVMRLDEKRVGIFLVDAVGHGMPAALLIPTGYRLLEPSETMRLLNEALIEQELSQCTFCTAIYGVLNTETLQLDLASGGHPAPLLVRNGELHDVPVEGSLLGIFPDQVFDQAHLQLQSGDRLLVFSDGIEIVFHEDMASHEDRWKKELASRADLPIEQMLTEFADKIDHEAGSLQPKDDLTLMAIEIK